ncbi:MAG: menaquinone biosynthesis decarboxylase [Nitrospinota bacterium]|nr:menaquinone biosynthesis decarboxylase [Nitrospinota bacterium]
MPQRRKTYENLGEFIDALEKECELVRILEEVDPILEITEIADRVSKSPGGGKALLFENVKGSDMPLLINGFGSVRRMAMALGVESVEDISSQISALLNIAPPESLMDKMRMIPVLMDLAKFPPRKVSGPAPCQEVVYKGDEVDLDIFPVLKCWPDDAGRFITFPLVFSKGLDGRRNLGMYRMQLFDRKTTGMHWHIHKDGAHHFHEYKKAGKKMEVAVAIGSDPVVTYSATAPLPRGVDELLLAGLIRKKPVNIVKCLTVDIFVPADAEIILEGYVDPSEELKIEGPFGDHTGYYSLSDHYPVFHVTAVTHRKKPAYFTTIVGKPPMEDCYMAEATSRIFLPMLKTVAPEIVDYKLPWEGVFHNCVLVGMEKEFPGAAQRLMSVMWGTGQMSFAKMILVLDSGIDLGDYQGVLETMLRNIDVSADLTVTEGVLDVLDHSAPNPLRGSKLGIDATGRFRGERERNLPKLETLDENVIRKEMVRLGIASFNILGADLPNRILVCAVNKRKEGKAKSKFDEIIKGPAGGMVNILLFVDEGIDTANLSTVAWKFFNNTDPGRDIILQENKLMLDATKKLASDGHSREWPADIEMSAEIKKGIDRLWPKLGIDT